MRYLLLVIVLPFCLIGCGFLDQELAMTDQEFEETMGVGGISMSGIGGGGCGCGGYSYSSRGSRMARIHRHAIEGDIESQIIDLEDDYIFGRRAGEEVETTFVEVPDPSAIQKVAEGVKEGRATLVSKHMAQPVEP